MRDGQKPAAVIDDDGALEFFNKSKSTTNKFLKLTKMLHKKGDMFEMVDDEGLLIHCELKTLKPRRYNMYFLLGDVRL